jgi:hypothetical protein
LPATGFSPKLSFMSRVVSVVVSSFVAVAFQAAVVAAAFAQAPPTIGPGVEPPPVTQQAAAPASAFDRPGFDLAARLGYAFPFGNAAGGTKLSDGVTGAVPVIVEAGYRINAHFLVGALVQYGFAQTSDGGAIECYASPCDSRVLRIGIQGIFNLDREAPLTRWLGIGTGYEWFNFNTAQGISGFELVTAQGGAEYRVTPQVALGPFFSLTLARYTTRYYGELREVLLDQRMHEWLQLGVRGHIGL